MPEVIAYVKKQDLNALYDFNPNSGHIAFPTPRSVAKASDIIKAMGLDNKISLDLRIALHGTCWEAWATQFDGFIRNSARMVSPDDIMKDPNGCPVPTGADLDALYATISSLIAYLSRNSDHQSILSAFKFAIRIVEKEMCIVLFKDIIRQILDKHVDVSARCKLLSTPEFNKVLTKCGEQLNIINLKDGGKII